MLMTSPPYEAVASFTNGTSATQPVHCFSLKADSEPGLLPRVIEVFARNSLVPSRWHSDLLGPHDDELSVDIQVRGLAQERAEYLARCMEQIYGVHSVLISRKL